MVSAVQGITSRIFYVAPFDLGEMIVLGVTFGRFCSAPGKLSLPIPARYLAANSDTFENTLALWDASASARICVKLTRVPRSADTALESGTEGFLEIFRSCGNRNSPPRFRRIFHLLPKLLPLKNYILPHL